MVTFQRCQPLLPQGLQGSFRQEHGPRTSFGNLFHHDRPNMWIVAAKRQIQTSYRRSVIVNCHIIISVNKTISSSTWRTNSIYVCGFWQSGGMKCETSRRERLPQGEVQSISPLRSAYHDVHHLLLDSKQSHMTFFEYNHSCFLVQTCIPFLNGK